MAGGQELLSALSGAVLLEVQLQWKVWGLALLYQHCPATGTWGLLLCLPVLRFGPHPPGKAFAFSHLFPRPVLSAAFFLLTCRIGRTGWQCGEGYSSVCVIEDGRKN